uniref:relaxase/mobilization nuclease domain-containing protein n=1 Tax=Arthrobacter sp. TaxID=1667 RepID=UPI000EB6CF8A|nr:relaxase/mobilization nuclease domain-containing protein [Arthrobacter sp.]AXV46418.1 relaxase, MobA [Arthrobacter sp.]
MIPNITRGSRMQGLLSYLVLVDQDKTANVHVDPHLVAGNATLMSWYDDAILDQEDADKIAAFLDRPRKNFGVDIMRRDDRKDAPLGSGGKPQLVKADVWHCSLSLREGERKVTDQEWGDIANDFIDEMGFSEAGGKAPCRWVAIDHGTSAKGNQHIHIAVSLVREDGTKASTHMDWPNSQKACRGLEKKYGLDELSTVHATRGYSRGEKEIAVREGREMHRTTLERKVRAVSTAAFTEADFVRGARNAGMLLRPRYEKDTTDVVVGYSVAQRPVQGERPVWFGGGKLARDLGLGQLRTKWPDTAQDSLDAVAEWNAAARNKRQVREQIRPSRAEASDAQLWEAHTVKAKEMADRLASLPVDDHASWAKVARETSGVFAAWSTQLETTPGPLAATAAELAHTAQLRDYRQHGQPVPMPSLASSTMLLLAAGSKSKTASQTALLMQLMRTTRAIYEMHQQSQRLREAKNLQRIFSLKLSRFAVEMPQATSGPASAKAQKTPAPAVRGFSEQDLPESLRLLRLSSPVPPNVRGGSVVPAKAEPARTYQPTKPGPEQDYGR